MPPDSTQALANLIAIIAGVIAIVTALYAGFKKFIAPLYRTWQDRRRLRSGLEYAKLYTREDIERATTFYIPPNCQQIDPAGGEESRLLAPVQEDLFKAVDRLLASPSDYKYIILLADSGMGKTSFVLNYYAYHWRHWRKWRRFDLAVVPLGTPKADELIRAVSNPANTVLLLDAFDEDTHAIRNHLERIGKLLDLTEDFR